MVRDVWQAAEGDTADLRFCNCTTTTCRGPPYRIDLRQHDQRLCAGIPGILVAGRSVEELTARAAEAIRLYWEPPET